MQQQDGKEYLWVERYRPTTLDTYLGNPLLKSKLTQYIAEQDIPHILLTGKAGTGKTTAAKILIKSIDCDYLFINASDENSVDTIRNKIKGFASTIGFSPLKIIVLDECLDENTLVWVLREGIECSIPIRDLQDGTDLVKSFNVSSNRIEWMPFRLWNKGIQETLEVELENGEVVVCTLDHKWYVEGPDGTPIVVRAKELSKYMHILSP